MTRRRGKGSGLYEIFSFRLPFMAFCAFSDFSGGFLVAKLVVV